MLGRLSWFFRPAPPSARQRPEGGSTGGTRVPSVVGILDPNPRVVDALMRLNLPAGVSIEIKL